MVAPGSESNSNNILGGKITNAACQGAFVEYEVGAAGTIFKARGTNTKGKTLPQRGDKVMLSFGSETMRCLARPGNEGRS